MAKRQGAEGWTLGLRSSRPNIEGFYVASNRGIIEGVAEGLPFRGELK